MNSKAFILLMVVIVLSAALISSSMLEHDVGAKKKVRQKIKIKNDCGKGVTCTNCAINISGLKIQKKGDC